MTTFTVSTATGLTTALAAARGGDSVLLAGGDYGGLTLYGPSRPYLRYTSEVTIASADPDNPAVFSDLNLSGVANITFEDVTFHYDPAESASAKPFVVNRSTGVAFVDADFEGTRRSGYGSGQGLRVTDSADITVSGSDFETLTVGAVFSRVTGVEVTDNDFRDIAQDSVDFGQVIGGRIEGNDFRDLNSDPTRAHKDAIQVWTTPNEGPSRDLVIRDNYIESPDGMTHGIFLDNDEAAGGNLAKYYRNILIEDNTLYTSHQHGITVEHTIGVTIRGNELIQNPEEGHISQVHFPLIEVTATSQQVAITNNTLPGQIVLPEGVNWSVSGNVDSTLDPQEAVEHRLDGATLSGTRTRTVTDLDFGAGDTLVFIRFDDGTFRDESGGNIVHNNTEGSYVRIDSALDLQESVQSSPALSVSIAGDDVTLAISQDTGTQRVILEGFADEFRAADQPELF